MPMTEAVRLAVLNVYAEVERACTESAFVLVICTPNYKAKSDGRKGGVGYEGDIVFDTSKPDGTPRKLLDVSRLTALGWEARIGLADGVSRAYRDLLETGGHRPAARG